MTPGAAVLLSLLAASAPQGAAPERAEAAVVDPVDRALGYLLESRNPDGSWGSGSNATFTDVWANPETHRAWRIGTSALCCMALLRLAETPEQLDALDAGLDFLARNATLKRPSDWDTDNVWGYLYGLQALAQALTDERRVRPERRDAIRAPAEEYLDRLLRYQSPNGGWAYYAFGDSAYRPSWATSFTTAIAIMALLDARAAGLPVEQARLDAAIRAVERCRLPSGAYTYSVLPVPGPGRLEGIDQIKGSLGRIQVCNLALHRAGAGIDRAELERGLEMFFDHRRFLEIARLRPIPHEAYYANAGYFFYFGHFYAGEVLAELPEPSRARYAGRLAEAITATQNDDGSMSDFVMHSYPRRYGTAYGIMTLARCEGG